MKKRRDVLAFVIIIGMTVIFLLVLFIVFKGAGNIDRLALTSGEKVGVLEIRGEIFNSRSFVKDLERFISIPAVKALVIRIDSPGGAVAASQELYAELKKAREELPVVVSMGNVAASGGYYAAIAADTIFANPGTTTGSIGVIAGITLFHRLTDKIGLDFEVLKSGDFKDTGNPFREMTEAERGYLQGWINDVYEQFIEAVAEERGLTLEEVKKVADGRVFTGRQAKELGLVDLLGDLQDAIALAGELGGIRGKPDILEKKKRKLTLFDILFGDFEEVVHRFSGNKVEVKYLMR